METIDPWLDVAAVRKLAERLLTPISQIHQASTARVQAEPREIDTPLKRQLEPFRNWMREQVRAHYSFLLSDNEEIVYDDSGSRRLARLAAGFMSRAWPNSMSPRSLQVKIGATEVLEIIPVEHQGRRYVLGAVLSLPLKKEALKVVIESLRGQLI